MVKNVGCFFTGGYTESNSMLIFLKRINDNIRFKQFALIEHVKGKETVLSVILLMKIAD